MKNLSPLFNGQKTSFIEALKLTSSQKQVINIAKQKVISKLRLGISRETKEAHGVSIKPRFLSQGSAVYKTQNQPCTKPPQQIDHDLGCYLPLSYIENEIIHPSIAADYFFTIIDKILASLVKEEGWLRFDSSKSTCSRVVINSEIHIDIPLYSIPDSEFHTIQDKLTESVDLAKSLSMESISRFNWLNIRNEVLLAHREEDWIKSDPRKLNDYFTDHFNTYGEQMRRICRYVKAWRDKKWDDGGPSSIYLMILVDKYFLHEESGRDDLKLLKIFKLISENREDIKNPTDLTETIRIKPTDKELLAMYSSEFANDLNEAIYGSSSALASCNLVRKHLGNRFPLSGVKIENENKREEILSIPASKDTERIPNSRSRAG